eukprot:scaffold1019_cov123-Cylindrotheca_fusiformis.AAC.7
MSNLELPLGNRDSPPSGFQRTVPMEGVEAQMNHGMNIKPRHSQAYPPRGYQYHHTHPSSRHPIQSVITTSFSTDEDREDRSGHHGHRHRYHNQYPDYRMDHGQHFETRSPLHDSNINAFEPTHSDRDQMQYGSDLSPIQESDLDIRNPPREVIVSRSMRVPPSPREQPLPMNRSYSEGMTLASSSFQSDGPLKRSFWHHAKSGDEYQNSLPNEFMPPKRSKTTGSGHREYVVTASRTFSEDMYDNMHSPDPNARSAPRGRAPGWFNRTASWETRDDYYHRKPAGSELQSGSWTRSPPSYREPAAPVSHWSDAPLMLSPRMRPPVEGGMRYELPPQGHTWSPRWHPEEPRWGGPQIRDDVEAMHFSPNMQEREPYDSFRRQGTFESRSDAEPPMRYINGPPSMPTNPGMDYSAAPLSHRVMPPKMNEAELGNSIESRNHNAEKTGPIRMLALPDDRISLSETLCLVRENIEVFTATKEDVEAPAPGRKQAIVVGQVGLRCIHCRHTTRSSERVKRAICYPSSIKRIYRSVIDMKLDHFLHCKFVPANLKDTLVALKANNTRSTGTTMQYFIRAAKSLGMVDAEPGVRLVNNAEEAAPGSLTPKAETTPNQSNLVSPNKKEEISSPESPLRINRNNSMSSEGTTGSTSVLDEEHMPKEIFMGKVNLSLPEDKTALSPLRCFLREQVCAFSASEEDIAVRTPTTFSVSVGQVGIACVHCLNQPAKSRLNRAVCFPFSITRIYQSVADIQRFHLGECKMVPKEIKEKFIELQNASSKGSKGLATRQYWVTSAKRLGLVDTTKGIRFSRDPSIPEEKAVSLDILAQVASNVTTVNRPLVLPEDKPLIAQFLYAVMEQLQPCRFTEADRNKRRLKDVGCIGVECKHCAGKVDSRKFFWSSVSAVESNFVSVHTHMMECKEIPDKLKEELAELKKLRKEQTIALKTGSQKAFFSRVWERLHTDEEADSDDDKAQDSGSAKNGAQEGNSKESAAPASPAPPEAGTKDKRQDGPKIPEPESPSTEKLKDKLAMVSV